MDFDNLKMWNCICLLWTLILNCNLYVFIAEDVSQWGVTVHMRWDPNGHKTIYDQRQLSINFTCNIIVWTHLSNDGIYKSSLTTQLQTIQTHKPVRRWNQLRHHRNLKLMNYQDYCIRNFPPSMLDWCGWTDSHFVWSHTDHVTTHSILLLATGTSSILLWPWKLWAGLCLMLGLITKTSPLKSRSLYDKQTLEEKFYIFCCMMNVLWNTIKLFDIGNVLVLNIDLRHQL